MRRLLPVQPLQKVRFLCFNLFLLLVFSPLHAEPSGERLQTLVPPGFAIGGVLHGYDYKDSFTYGAYRNIADEEFNAVTVSAYMPWSVWENPAQGPVTSGLTRITDWTVERGKRVHGHALVYPYANTHLPWFQALDNAAVEATLKRYVQTMASSTRGKMWVWDVVNEVIGDNDNIQNNRGVDEIGVRTGIEINGNFVSFPEYRAMGREYISKAFYWAKQADPNAQLIINDYAIAEKNPKSDALFNFAVDLKARGVPIDGIGFQMHWTEPDYQPRFDNIRENFQRFANAGFRLYITELDVAMVNTSTPTRVDWSRKVGWRNADGSTESISLSERQARVYAGLLDVALSVPAVEAFLFWDFADDQSWLHPNNDNNYLFPTPFWGGDTAGENPISAKPAYYAMQTTLQQHSTDDDNDNNNNNPVLGTYRLTSTWDSTTSWLGREGIPNGSGGWMPDNQLGLFRLDKKSRQWGSLRWTIETAPANVSGNRPASNAVRLRNGWAADSGYLSRDAAFDRAGWTPGTGVGLLPADAHALGQLWVLEPSSLGRYRLKSYAESGGAVYLTRDGVSTGDNIYLPGRTVNLYLDEGWISQVWELRRVE